MMTRQLRYIQNCSAIRWQRYIFDYLTTELSISRRFKLLLNYLTNFRPTIQRRERMVPNQSAVSTRLKIIRYGLRRRKWMPSIRTSFRNQQTTKWPLSCQQSSANAILLLLRFYGISIVSSMKDRNYHEGERARVTLDLARSREAERTRV